MGEQTQPQPLDGADASDLVMYVATRLGETDQRPLRQIRRFADALGRQGLLDVLEESIRADEAGGLYLDDGRRRSLGGVFFFFAKQRLGLATGSPERDRDGEPASTREELGSPQGGDPRSAGTPETGKSQGNAGGPPPARSALQGGPQHGGGQLELFRRSSGREAQGSDRGAPRRPQRSGPEIVIRRRVLSDLERQPSAGTEPGQQATQSSASEAGSPSGASAEGDKAEETRPRRRIVLLSPARPEPEPQPGPSLQTAEGAAAPRRRRRATSPREGSVSSRELRRTPPPERETVERDEAEPRPSKRPPREEPAPEPPTDPRLLQQRAEAVALARLERPTNALVRALADQLHELVMKAVIGELGSLTTIAESGKLSLSRGATPGRGPVTQRKRAAQPARARAREPVRARATSSGRGRARPPRS